MEAFFLVCGSRPTCGSIKGASDEQYYVVRLSNKGLTRDKVKEVHM